MCYARADVNFGNSIMLSFDIFAYIVSLKDEKFEWFKFSVKQIAAHMHAREFMIFWDRSQNYI